jgi:hypothetical protein
MCRKDGTLLLHRAPLKCHLTCHLFSARATGDGGCAFADPAAQSIIIHHGRCAFADPAARSIIGKDRISTPGFMSRGFHKCSFYLLPDVCNQTQVAFRCEHAASTPKPPVSAGAPLHSRSHPALLSLLPSWKKEVGVMREARHAGDLGHQTICGRDTGGTGIRMAIKHPAVCRAFHSL